MDSPLNVAQKLIRDHLISGEMVPGEEIGLKIDHVLQQDATGTLVMLELEAMGLNKIEAEVGVQYVDHNLLQTDHKNADDHEFLQSAAERFGYWFSRAGNGVSHPVHMERFGKPGKTLLGSDSHTPAGGGLGMLAIGTGGLDVAMAAAGEPYYVKMPKIMGIELTGSLPDWVSAKDVVLEMLRRYDVKGGRNFILEYYGPGIKNLSAWDRHVIANMGTELGATTTVFPSDDITHFFLRQQKREQDYVALEADKGCSYDAHEEIDLNQLEPLIALPSSPGNVVPVKEVAGKKVAQVVIGSSANPGLRDFWVVSEILRDRSIAPEVSLDVNPSSRQNIQNLTAMGSLEQLIAVGARFHQTGCMGCIGMGQAPGSKDVSLRTVPRNFPGRSGTEDDQVYLCSPETAAAAALTGKIIDPRTLQKEYNIAYPRFNAPEELHINTMMLVHPEHKKFGGELKKGPNIKSLPEFDKLPDHMELTILLKMDDNISTDEILKAGAEVLPLRSNIPDISKYAYHVIDHDFYERAKNLDNEYGFMVIAGENYAQGSSREHAALAPRYLGQRAAIAKSYARIGWQNLINFGIIPFEFEDPSDHDQLQQGDVLVFNDLRENIKENKGAITAKVKDADREVKLVYHLSSRQTHVIQEGGMINALKRKMEKEES